MRRSLQKQESGERLGRLGQRLGRRALAAIAAVGMATCAPALSRQNSASTEYQVKAAFLYHFAQFVDWPAEAFKDANSPITYCTIGEDPFQGALDASLDGKTLGPRRLRVQHLKRPGGLDGCQVLFIGNEEKTSIANKLASLEEKPVLTVGESEHFAEDGGMIGFCLEDNKVRFEINLAAAEHAKLKISARLLTLARKVIGSTKGN